MTLSDEDAATAHEMSKRLPLTTEVVQAMVRTRIKDQFQMSESLANGGAMVYLDETADAIWTAAINEAFDEWLSTVRLSNDS